MRARKTEVVEPYSDIFGEFSSWLSHSTAPLPSYSFQKFMFDNIIFVHQWSTIISYQFMILFVGIQKQYWHTHFLWWVLSTKKACFMVMARLITAFPSECSDNQSSSDKKVTAFWCENRCYVYCLVPLQMASVDSIIIMFSFVWNGFKGSTQGEPGPWLQPQYHPVAGMSSSSQQPCRISNAMLCLLL